MLTNPDPDKPWLSLSPRRCSGCSGSNRSAPGPARGECRLGQCRQRSLGRIGGGATKRTGRDPPCCCCCCCCCCRGRVPPSAGAAAEAAAAGGAGAVCGSGAGHAGASGGADTGTARQVRLEEGGRIWGVKGGRGCNTPGGSWEGGRGDEKASSRACLVPFLCLETRHCQPAPPPRSYPPDSERSVSIGRSVLPVLSGVEHRLGNMCGRARQAMQQGPHGGGGPLALRG